ncbi:MAG: CARDB domain-containing protein [Pseudomonadota bacterium]
MPTSSVFSRPAIWAAGLLALGAGACASPDLTVSRLDVTPTTIEQGADYSVVAEMRNDGAGAARTKSDGRNASMIVELQDAPAAPTGETITAVGAPGDLSPGDMQGLSINPTMSPTKAPGTYYVCATADFPEIYAESDETNNERCQTISVILPRPDLIVTGAKTGAASGVSRRIYINVSNVGGSTAENFRVDVFQTAPSPWPLLVTTCPLTSIPGGSAPCPSPFIESLAPGDTETVAAWVTFPADRTSGVTETVRAVADGCHPPTEPVSLPGYCRVDESNEGNNDISLSITAP